MARRGRTSIVREVKEALDAIDRIGHSKKLAREKGEHAIHSIKQKENTMSDAQNFVKWVRAEHGVKSIGSLDEGHYQKYMAYLDGKGLSKGHMRNVETSLRFLQEGFKTRSERFEEGSEHFKGFCPENRIVSYQINENIQNRAYTLQEINAIKKNCSNEVQKAVDLMYGLGLRVKEAANIQAGHFHKDEDGWRLQIVLGAGITKGGRFREIVISNAFNERLNSLLYGKACNERIIKVSPTTIRDGINVACKKAGIEQRNRGTHGFRHAYARNRADQLMTRSERQMMDRILSNREIGRKADYGINAEKDKQLFANVREKINLIHSELGHGANRWELAMRYLKG